MTYERGIYHLVKAAGKANAKWLLAGKFVSAQFEEQVKRLPEFSFVIYLGTIPKTEVAKII